MAPFCCCNGLHLQYLLWLALQLPVQSVPFSTKVVSLNPVHGEVYSIQYYVIMFVWFTTGRWFSPVSSTNKAYCHDITEVLLKVVLNTINLFIILFLFWNHCTLMILYSVSFVCNDVKSKIVTTVEHTCN